MSVRLMGCLVTVLILVMTFWNCCLALILRMVRIVLLRFSVEMSARESLNLRGKNRLTRSVK
jgi:hypothetical protein